MCILVTRRKLFQFLPYHYVQYIYNNNNTNEFAQSNLGRGPRRSTVAHVRRKVPIGYNGAPQIRPQKYHYLPHPWTRPTYNAKQHPDPIRRFSQCTGKTDRQTDRPTDRRPRVSLTTIGRFTTKRRGLIIIWFTKRQCVQGLQWRWRTVAMVWTNSE